MIGTKVIILNTVNGKREILPLPFMLQSKNPLAEFKDGKFTKMFFYEHWVDEAYKANLEQEYLSDNFKTEEYLINYGQDFGKYYLGYINIDFDNKSYSIPEDQANHIEDLKALGDLLFDESKESRKMIIFTPTKPSDIHVIRA